MASTNGKNAVVSSEDTGKRPRKRTRWQKVGRSRYNQQLLKRLLKEVSAIRATQNLILKGLQSMFRFDRPFLAGIACETSVEEAAVDAVYQSGSVGVYSYQVAEKVGISRHAAGRTMHRLNRRLEKAIGMRLVERKSRRWVLTPFGVRAWRLSEEEALEEKARLAREMDEEAEEQEAKAVD
jgi:hypothetical protein